MQQSECTFQTLIIMVVQVMELTAKVTDLVIGIYIEKLKTHFVLSFDMSGILVWLTFL